MSLNIGKRDVAKAAKLLEEPYDSAEDAARALLEFAFDLYESKFKFTVVGQMRYNPHQEGASKYLDAEDAAASRIALGAYGTQKQAEAAAYSLTYSNGIEFNTWWLPAFHGTPAAHFTRINNERKAREAAEGSKLMAELERRAKWFEENPGALTFEPNPDQTAVEAIGWGGVTPSVTPEAA